MLRRLPAARDVRIWLLAAALICAALGALPLRIEHRQRLLDLLLVVDITGSMNVRDYQGDHGPESRLVHVKGVLQQLLARMPCGSRVGLAVFSERRSFLLLAPVEVCENFDPLARTIGELDWRMAWEGDSHIAGGLHKAIEQALSLGADVVFMSDGQETPPLPYNGGPPYEGQPGAVKGLIVGVGDYRLSPIPKFDEFGIETGFLAEQDVEQESRVGLPPPDAARRPGYSPRNAPFGADMPHGNEHLSSVRENYLQSLARDTGLGYVHLDADTDLLRAIEARASTRPGWESMRLTPWFAALGLMALVTVYLHEPLQLLLRWLRPRLIGRQRAGVGPTAFDWSRV